MSKPQGNWGNWGGLGGTGLQLAQKMENSLYLAWTWGELGRLAYHQQDDPQAEKRLKHALDSHKQIGAIVFASNWMFHLAQLYERQERFDKALPLLQESVGIAERTGLAKLAKRQAALTRVRKKMGLPTGQHSDSHQFRNLPPKQT